MRTLQRYILFDLVRTLVLIISILTVLLVFVGVFREVSESGLGPLQVLEILPFVVPSMLPFTIPATLLLAVCVVYGKLSADYEVTAAKAAGINVLSLLFPAFFLGAILTVCSLLLNDQVIPWSMANIRNIVTLAMEDIFFDVLASQNMVEDVEKGIAITVAHVDLDQRRLIRPNIRYSPRGGEPVIVQAREATLRFELDRQEAVLELQDAYIDAPGDVSVRFVNQEFSVPLSMSGGRIKPRHMSIKDIREKLADFRRQTQVNAEMQAAEMAIALGRGDFDTFVTDDFRRYGSNIVSGVSQAKKHRTELHSRFAMSCSCFFFALVGGPFSILMARRQFLTTFFLCFMPILLVYYPVVLLMMNLSKSGTVDPAWAMWAGNLCLLIAAGVVIRRAVQH